MRNFCLHTPLYNQTMCAEQKERDKNLRETLRKAEKQRKNCAQFTFSKHVFKWLHTYLSVRACVWFFHNMLWTILG